MIMAEHKIYKMSFSKVYPLYKKKVESEDRSKEEVDEIIRWLKGYSDEALQAQIEKEVNFEEFFDQSPELNPARREVKGVICGVRVEDIEEPLMQEIRYMDKMIDELAKGKKMETILR